MGAGGLAKELAQLARRIDPEARRWSAIEYVAESADSLGSDLPFGKVRWIDADVVERTSPCDVVVGIGYPSVRRAMAAMLATNEYLSFPNLIHPSVEIDEQLVQLGRGNIIASGAVVTCDIVIGDFNLINWNVTVGHDTRIGSFNVLNPGTNLSGCTSLGDACLLGTGCQVLERLTIASDVTIGAGAVVIRPIDAPGVYVGIPAAAVR